MQMREAGDDEPRGYINSLHRHITHSITQRDITYNIAHRDITHSIAATRQAV